MPSHTRFTAIEVDEPLRLDQLDSPYHLEQLHGRRVGKGSEAGAWLIGVESEVVAVLVRRVEPSESALVVRVGVDWADGGGLWSTLATVDGVPSEVSSVFRLGDGRLVSPGETLRAVVEGPGDVLVCIVLRRPHARG